VGWAGLMPFEHLSDLEAAKRGVTFESAGRAVLGLAALGCEVDDLARFAGRVS